MKNLPQSVHTFLSPMLSIFYYFFIAYLKAIENVQHFEKSVEPHISSILSIFEIIDSKRPVNV